MSESILRRSVAAALVCTSFHGHRHGSDRAASLAGRALIHLATTHIFSTRGDNGYIQEVLSRQDISGIENGLTWLLRKRAFPWLVPKPNEHAKNASSKNSGRAPRKPWKVKEALLLLFTQ